jgi:hypothetical protein
MEVKAALIPRQAAMGDDATRHRFNIRNCILLMDVKHASGRQHAVPMRHQGIWKLPSVKSLQEMQVSTGSRTVWMMVALGSARWIKPAKRKFAGILSVLRDTSAPKWPCTS